MHFVRTFSITPASAVKGLLLLRKFEIMEKLYSSKNTFENFGVVFFCGGVYPLHPPLVDNLAKAHGSGAFPRLRHCWESGTQLTLFPLN